MRTIRVTLPVEVVARLVIEHASSTCGQYRNAWPARVTGRDAWGDWEVTFTEPSPEPEPKPEEPNS